MHNWFDCTNSKPWDNIPRDHGGNFSIIWLKNLNCLLSATAMRFFTGESLMDFVSMQDDRLYTTGSTAPQIDSFGTIY